MTTEHVSVLLSELECIRTSIEAGMSYDALEDINAILSRVTPSDEYNGWYCAQCQCGVDASEVTYNEQHEACGRVITNDRPPSEPRVVTDELVERLKTACRALIRDRVVYAEDVDTLVEVIRTLSVTPGYFATSLPAARVPDGWKVEIDVGPEKAVHVTAPDGKWIGVIDFTPREKLLADFFRALLAAAPQAGERG